MTKQRVLVLIMMTHPATSRGLLRAVAFLSVALAATPLAAQTIERLGDFQDWSAFKFKESGKDACYIASQPTKQEGKYSKRGDIYALVTHRPAEGRRDEVSFVAGYTYKPESAVEVTIGSTTQKLFTQDDSAWAVDKETDVALVRSMIRGNNMVVQGTSSRGTLTTDTYSLKGFTAAYKAIGKGLPLTGTALRSAGVLI